MIQNGCVNNRPAEMLFEISTNKKTPVAGCFLMMVVNALFSHDVIISSATFSL
jgi:hypothetical protein